MALPSRLRAARHYAGALTGIVSVADDGGSSGRLRRRARDRPSGRPAQVPRGSRRRSL